MAKMDETELQSIVDGWISDARQFDQSDASTQREWAIKFYDGEVDIAARDGRSSAVSHDVADVLDWIIAGLLRVFTASDRVAIYEPREPQDVAAAKQATDCINYIFLNECDGYKVIMHSMHDGLLHGNGPIKVWWEGKPEYKTETIRGITESELMALMTEPDVEDILEINLSEEPKDGPDAAAAY